MINHWRVLCLGILILAAFSGCKREEPPPGFKNVLTAQDEWFYSGTSRSVIGALYTSGTPMTEIYHGTLDMYLQKRDAMLTDNGIKPSDIGSDQLTSSSRTIMKDGVSYGVAIAEYPLLQIVTVSKGDDRGYYTVTCARYRNIPEISLHSGFCADAIRKRLEANLAD